MKWFAGTALMLVFLTEAGLAESCREQFVRLLVEGNGDAPAKIHVTQEIQGGMKSINYFYQQTKDHWMSEAVEPAEMAWTLGFAGKMFTSADGGRSWQLLREMDGAAAEQARADLVENATTAREAVCGEEEMEGATYRTVEGIYDTLSGFRLQNTNKYWLEPESGWIARASYRMKGEGFESLTMQVIEAAPDLSLPMPE